MELFLPHYLLLIIYYSLFLRTIQDLLFPLIFPEILLVFMRIELANLQVCYAFLTCQSSCSICSVVLWKYMGLLSLHIFIKICCIVLFQTIYDRHVCLSNCFPRVIQVISCTEHFFFLMHSLKCMFRILKKRGTLLVLPLYHSLSVFISILVLYCRFISLCLCFFIVSECLEHSNDKPLRGVF